ncbi:hypothetical protein HDU96_005233 [Phlyctochytrium bullatum]|nr:hypothetical protein HDU96_005233 [Phlyctochytrium bullatum]
MTLSHGKEAIDSYSQIMISGPLDASNAKVPESLRYHLVDSLTEEITKAIADDSEFQPNWKELVIDFYDPLIMLLRDSRNPILLEKVESQLWGLEELRSDDDQIIEIQEVSKKIDDLLAAGLGTELNKRACNRLKSRFAKTAPKALEPLVPARAVPKKKKKKKLITGKKKLITGGGEKKGKGRMRKVI